VFTGKLIAEVAESAGVAPLPQAARVAIVEQGLEDFLGDLGPEHYLTSSHVS